MSSDFSVDWFLKYAEGTLVGYAKDRIEFNRAKGMLRTAVKYIGKEKLSLIIKNIEENPIYLSQMSREDKIKKLEPLEKELIQIR